MLIICLIIIGHSPRASSQDYFQQEVNYSIHVKLDDNKNELNAFETIEYINNSPDTLQSLIFHLWANGYSGNNTSLASQLNTIDGKEKLFHDPELKGYIDSLNFRVDDHYVQWNLLPDFPDICKIFLNKPLKAGDTIIISTPFHVKIPKGVTSRLGHIGQSYQITQWYPKPAVYDRSGWHGMPYLDQGEFFSEFGSFDVRITLPANYIVGATGNLLNMEEAEILDKMANDTVWKYTLDSIDTDEIPPSSPQLKTLHYTQDQIHDFAWFADKRFHVLKGKVKLPYSGKDVTTWVLFTNQQANLWKDAIQYLNKSIEYFSCWIGDYPYNSFTAVQSALSAGVGMEYPGITVIGLVDDAYSLDDVIAHEACHNWFYSALGSDERQYPYMDEGIVSSYESRYLRVKYPGKKLWETYYKNRKLANFFHIDQMPVERMQEIEWLIQARSNLEQQINLPATEYSTMNYGLILYNKTSQVFNYLRAYLGDSLFDSIMHDYYTVWKFRHPQPDDLQMLFESHTDKDLAWFFCDMLGTTKRLDYSIKRYKNLQLLLKNNGEMTSPLVISGSKGDSIYFQKWVEGFEGQKWIDIPPGSFSEIRIDSMHLMPELYRLNNNIRTSGAFRKADPFRFQLFVTLEDPDKRYVMYIPAVDWNKENGLMPGVIFQNKFLLPKKVEYIVMPFYSFKKSGIAGYGRISYNITPYANFIRLAKISLEGTQFGAPGKYNYYSAKTGFDLFYKTINMNNPVHQKVFGYFNIASDLMQIEQLQKGKMRSYLQFGYMLEKDGIINPYNLLVSSESNKSFQKISLEFNYKLSYNGKKNGLETRLFAGKMLKDISNEPFYALAASGRGGLDQYLYQGYFPDRFAVFPESFWSRQMTISEGGLVSPVNDSLGFSSWLISLSIASNLPGIAGRIPVKPFVNILWNDHGLSKIYNSSYFFEAGIKVGIWNIFEVYFPLLVSSNIRSINGSIKDRIRIVLNLNSLSQINLNSKFL
jgi:hypothetical protein